MSAATVGFKDEPSVSEQITVPNVPVEIELSLQRQAQQSDEQERHQLDQQAVDDHADRGQARRLRAKYAREIYFLVLGWMGCIFVLLLAQGLGSFSGHPFNLPENVLLAAIGSTTVNVIALLVIVLNFIFPSEPPK